VFVTETGVVQFYLLRCDSSCVVVLANCLIFIEGV